MHAHFIAHAVVEYEPPDETAADALDAYLADNDTSEAWQLYDPEGSEDYARAVRYARELVEDGTNVEYARGICEILGELFPVIDMDLGTRAEEIRHDLLTPTATALPPQKIMRCADEKDWPERTFELQGDGPTYQCSHCGWLQEDFGGGLHELLWSASWHSAASYAVFADEAKRQGRDDVPAWPLNIEPDTAPPARLRSYRFPHVDPPTD